MTLPTDALGRKLPPTQEKERPDVQILADYVNRLVEHVRPEDMLKELHLVDDSAQVRVTYKGGKHLSDVLRDTNQFRFCAPACQCGMPDGAHLCIPSVSWIPDQFADVKRMLAKGLNHVPCAPLDPEPVIAQNVQIACAFGGPTVAQAARLWCMSRLSSACITPVDAVDFSSQNPGVRHVTDTCFVSCVDKAANHPMFICKHLAVSMALQHCRESAAFQPVDWLPNPHAVVNSLKQCAECVPSLSSPAPRFATMYPVVKVHKQGWRFITSAVGTVLHDAAIVLQAASACIIEELKEYGALCNRSALWKGCQVQHFPLINDTRMCIVNVNPGDKHLCDFSADVDHCFDVIPHQDLLAALQAHSERVVQMYRRKHRGKEPRFVLSTQMQDGHLVVTSVAFTHRNCTGKQVSLSVSAWLEMSEIVLGNCILQVGGCLFRVVAGIPQGLHCSPDWCNLFLLHHEINFVKTNPHDAHDVLLHWFRQVDDVRVLVKETPYTLSKNMNVAQWHTLLRHMLSRVYPAPLNLSLTCTVADDLVSEPSILCTTNFLDLSTDLLPTGHLCVSIIRKEKKLPIDVCQYVHLGSNRPVHQCYNVLSGLVVNVIWRCTSPKCCLSELKHLCMKFIANGHQKNQLLRVIDKSVLKDFSFLSLEYDPKQLWSVNRWKFARDL